MQANMGPLNANIFGTAGATKLKFRVNVVLGGGYLRNPTLRSKLTPYLRLEICKNETFGGSSSETVNARKLKFGVQIATDTILDGSQKDQE